VLADKKSSVEEGQRCFSRATSSDPVSKEKDNLLTGGSQMPVAGSRNATPIIAGRFDKTPGVRFTPKKTDVIGAQEPDPVQTGWLWRCF